MRSFRTASLGGLGLLALAGCGSSGNSSLFGGGVGAAASSSGGAHAGGSSGIGNGAGGQSGGGLGNSSTGGTLPADASLGNGGVFGAGGQFGDAAIPKPRDGGVQPFGVATPGTVFCAGVACTLAAFPANTCCVGALPFPTECLPTFPGCVNGGVAQISCDDATDCNNGQVCCGTLKGNVLTSGCAASCQNGAFEVCRTQAECPNQRCEPIQDATEYGRCK